MRARLLFYLFVLLSPAVIAQNLKIATIYARFGLGASQFWYQHHFRETHTADSILYDYDNEGVKATHAGLSIHAEGGYCFARPFRLGANVRARVYLENSTELPGIFTWLSVGPTAEYYFNDAIALFARAHYLFDTQFRDAENRFSWGAGAGIRYQPPEIPHCSIHLVAEYAGTKGDFLRYQQNPNSPTPIRIEQLINNRGFLLEVGLNVEL